MLEKKISSIKLDKSIENFKKSFQITPVLIGDFNSVLVQTPATKFISHDNTKLYLILSFFIGILTGIFYVLLREIFWAHKKL